MYSDCTDLDEDEQHALDIGSDHVFRSVVTFGQTMRKFRRSCRRRKAIPQQITWCCDMHRLLLARGQQHYAVEDLAPKDGRVASERRSVVDRLSHDETADLVPYVDDHAPSSRDCGGSRRLAQAVLSRNVFGV